MNERTNDTNRCALSVTHGTHSARFAALVLADVRQGQDESVVLARYGICRCELIRILRGARP